MASLKNSKLYRYSVQLLPEIAPVAMLCFASVNLIGFLGIRYWLGFGDQGKNPKYLVLAILAILIWSWGFGLLAKRKIVWNHLLVLNLPILYIVMEFINFTGLTKLQFYCQVYHYIFYGMLLLALDIFIRDMLHYPQLRRFLLWALGIFEGALLLLPFLLIANVCLNSSGIDYDAIAAICQTDQNEAFSYFLSNNGPLFIIITLILAVLCIWLIRHMHLRAMSFPPSRKLLLLLLLPVLPLWLVGILANQFAYFMPLTWKTAWFPRDYYAQIKRYKRNVELRAATIAELLKDEDKNNGNDGLFVLVIGESLNRNYMQCYGYHKATTPFQQKLLQKPTSFRFRKFYACHAMTGKVFTLLLTHRNQYDGMKIRMDDAMSIIDLLKHYGYRTAWFSNHYLHSVDAVTTPLISQADTIFSLKDNNPDSTAKFDIELLDEIKKLEPNKRDVIFLNLWGNHLPYATTYPKDFQAPDHFSPYEKSVLYNDFVIKELFEYFSQRNLKALIYVSDHSDAVSIGKGHDSRDRAFTREMVEIPCWIYLSPDYAASQPELLEKLKNSTNKMITNDLIFNLMLEILTIQNVYTPKHFSPFSSEYMIDADNASTLWGKRLLF